MVNLATHEAVSPKVERVFIGSLNNQSKRCQKGLRHVSTWKPHSSEIKLYLFEEIFYCLELAASDFEIFNIRTEQNLTFKIY